jgi:hypothetical protein
MPVFPRGLYCNVLQLPLKTLFLLEIILYQFLQYFVPLKPADQAAGIAVAGNISGVPDNRYPTSWLIGL